MSLNNNWLFFFLIQPKNVRVNGAIYQNCKALNVVSSNKALALQLGWEGIPFNLIFNALIFLILIFIFALLRRRAWTRKPQLIPRTKRGWLQFIYGDRENEFPKRRLNEDKLVQKHIHGIRHEQLFQLMREGESNGNGVRPPLSSSKVRVVPSPDLAPSGIEVIISDAEKPNHKNHQRHLSNESQISPGESNHTPTGPYRGYSTVELGYWILDLLLIKDADIMAKKGPDAVHYLIFQRYIIYFLLILTVICITIVLPINLTGDVEIRPFAQTTISNIAPGSGLLWVHLSCSVVLLAASLWMMCHFSRIVNADSNQHLKRTLLIRNVPKKKRVQAALMQYFERIFPNIGVEGIQFVYDTRRLRQLHSQYISCVNARSYCVEYNCINNRRLHVNSCPLGRMGGCCAAVSSRKDALAYYEEQIEQLEGQVTKEFYQTIGRPLGTAFITFQTEAMAKTVYQHLVELHEQSWAHLLSSKCFRCWPNFLKLHNADEMLSDRWVVSKAPYPEDINWDDIGIDHRMVWFRKAVVNLILFLVFFFLSTPSIFINTLNYLQISQTISAGLQHISPLFSEYFSPLLMVIFSIILPAFVVIACDYLPFKTFSDKNYSVMWKVFFFLLLMVVILPSLGLTSAKGLVLSAINNSTQTFECLFPVDNGAFFVNYVLQSTFLANATELLRFSELFLYFFNYAFFTKTEAEFEKARREIIFDFQFGIRYPRFLLMFCLVVTYSLTCPVIAPCGLLYMGVKHLVDRYNIYYIYTPSKISASIHSSAITFFQIAILMMLFQMSTFITLRTGSSYMSTFSLIILFVAAIIFFGQCFCHCCWNIGVTIPVTKKNNAPPQKDNCSCSYLAPVLYDINVDGIFNE